jgi:hypothetical protein
MTHACNPSTWGVEAEENKFQASLSPCQKKEKREREREKGREEG